MTFLHIAKIFGILFLGGFLTSLAERIFQYSLFETIAGLFHKKQ